MRNLVTKAARILMSVFRFWDIIHFRNFVTILFTEYFWKTAFIFTNLKFLFKLRKRVI